MKGLDTFGTMCWIHWRDEQYSKYNSQNWSHWKTGYILNVFAVFPKYPQNILDVDHCGWNDGDIPNVPHPTISGSPFWLILNFTDWEHCDHTGGNITKEIANEPLRNTAVTFFGKIQDVPITFLFGTSRSHDLEHCECTGSFLSMSHSGTLQYFFWENSKCTHVLPNQDTTVTSLGTL